MERETRGSLLNGVLGYIKKKWGQEGVDELCLETGVKPKYKGGSFYDDEISKTILQWIGARGQEYVLECGRYAVTHMGVAGWIVRIAKPTPDKIYKKAMENMTEVFKFGSTECIIQDDRTIILRAKDVCFFMESCLAWQGAFEGALEMSKAKGTVTMTKCQVDGGDMCEWEVKLEKSISK